ncbi:MAG: aromatic ring-hydroxylating dioxygenase subunit alpha [Pseudomonadota bacterium]
MTEQKVTKADVLRRVDLGLRSLWYPVTPSWALGANPLGLTRLGEHIVLWRDGEGGVHCLEDRCPHRGARLSLGWNLGDRVACWYHGVQLNQDGEIADVPAINTKALIGRKCLKTYPTIERHDAVWVYFGGEGEEAPPLELPEQLTSESYASFLSVANWGVCHSYAMENVADPMHGAYLHSASHSMARGDKTSDMALSETEFGFRFEKTDQSGVNFDWVEFGLTTAPWLILEIPYGSGAGPGGNFGIVGVTTPVDENNCVVFFWRTRKVEGWRRDLWRFMYRTRLEGLHWDVLEQDRVVLENLTPNARDKEMLYKHDLGLGHLRKLLRKIAKDQLTAELGADQAA